MKKIIKTLTILLSLTLTACTLINKDHQAQPVEIEEIYTPTSLAFIDSGEVYLNTNETILLSDIEKLIPNEYQDYDSISLPIIFDNDKIYFITQVHKDSGRKLQDMFSYNIDTLELEYISDLSSLNLELYRFIVIDEDIYILASKSSNMLLYYLNENAPVLLADNVWPGVSKYANGVIVAMKNDSDYFDIIKFHKLDRLEVLSVPTENYISSILTSSNISWMTYSLIESNHYYSFINNEIKSFQIDGDSLTLLKHVYTYINRDENGFDTIYIMNYNGEEIFSLTGESLYLDGTNNDNTFIYTNSTTSATYKIVIDSKNNTITSTELKSNDISDFSSFLFSNENIVHYNDSQISFFIYPF